MVCLSFDIEEFDMPLEYNGKIDFEEQISISRRGTEIILDLLKKYDIKATFFSTVIFAENNQNLIQRLIKEGHELASHTYYHSQFNTEDLKKSKDKLEELFGKKILGLRMPRMRDVDEAEVQKAGYFYNSSLNPTLLPGRYNNLHVSRTSFMEEGVLQIPASVTPRMRFPLFWLSFHNLPLSVYLEMAKTTYLKDNFLNIYFHPWEFMDISKKEYQLPFYAKRNMGKKMIERFEEFLSWINENEYSTNTLKEYAELQA